MAEAFSKWGGGDKSTGEGASVPASSLYSAIYMYAEITQASQCTVCDSVLPT